MIETANDSAKESSLPSTPHRACSSRFYDVRGLPQTIVPVSLISGVTAQVRSEKYEVNPERLGGLQRSI